MAPQLRKGKPKGAIAAPAEKPAAKTKKAATEVKAPKVEKRKANEDASPAAKKKQKAVNGAGVVTATKPVKEVAKKEAPKKSALKKEKPSKKTKKPVPEEQKEDEAGFSGNEDEEVDANTQALVETLDSGADEGGDDAKQISTYEKGQDVGKIPKPKKVVKAVASSTSGKPGVMYLGSVPHGFYEHEIREYFSQFGEITRLRVVRNKKTGASRHRAFVEFADTEVADIAARTMDNYLLFGHILRAKLVQPDQVHPELFKGANRRFNVVPWNAMQGRHLQRPLGETKWQGKIAREETRRAARAEKLKALGYEFEAPGLKAAVAKVPSDQIEAAEGEIEKTVEAPKVKQIEDKKEEAKEVRSPVAISQQTKSKKGSKGKKVKA